MKKVLFILSLLICSQLIATNSVVTVTNAATNIRVPAYSTKLMRWTEIHNIKDATPAILILPQPSSSAYTNRVTVTYLDGFTNVTTNVEYSVDTPVSFDTTLWPWADANGITYGIAVITNPVTTGTSNLWINADGTSNGWILIQ